MLKENLVLIAKTSSKLLFQFVILFVPISVLNWIYSLLVFISNFSTVSSGNEYKLILLLILFLAVFPFLYFNVAKDSAIKKGLNFLVNKNKVILIEYIINKLLANSTLKVLDNTTVQNGLLKTQNFISLLGKLPKGINWIVKYFTKKIPFAEVLTEYLQSYSINENNLQSASSAIANTINERFDVNIFNEKKNFYILLLAINIISMIIYPFLIS